MTTNPAPAIQVLDVAKRFQRGERHDSLRDLIPALVRRAGARRPDPGAAGTAGTAGAPAHASDAIALARDEFWAVRDLTFHVEFGRALGIIGPNGAGKSTTLKLLTGILRPTTGEIRMRGRVASLIEVSAGFHQDLTGRENVYLQGAVMGMTRREVAQRLASIVDFSGIEPFIDTPVKRYSSGMNARLGFAIAVHLDPDVLVIDEVLSVGDMSFQQKCVDRMQQFKRDGVAIVFVSHNMQAVGELCDEALVVKGTPRFQGPVGDAVACYLSISGQDGATREGEGITVESVELTDAAGLVVDGAVPGASLVLHAHYRVSGPLGSLVWSLVMRRATDGLVVADGAFSSEELGLGPLNAGDEVHLRLPHTAHLARGQYVYEVNVYDPQRARHLLLYQPAASLRIDEYRSYNGVADLELHGLVQVRRAGGPAVDWTRSASA
ncbi:MAG TPA: polysaccharide ABC transporter ATP-binding protein [Gemmatirosa sp.]|nr:polysaccharide ABC transporter ATP-binding protein [Gemmatirosa sp.]